MLSSRIRVEGSLERTAELGLKRRSRFFATFSLTKGLCLAQGMFVISA